MEETTEAFDLFISKLKALCRTHGVQIAINGYCGITIWSLNEGEREIDATEISDMTDENLFRRKRLPFDPLLK